MAYIILLRILRIRRSAPFSSPYRPSLPRMWDCRYVSASQFFVFLLSLAFFSHLDHARYDIIVSTRTAAAVQASYSSLESEEYSLFAVRSIQTLCRLHGPFSADVYMYSTRKHLHVQPFCFFVVVRFRFTYEISTDGLRLIYWVLVYKRILLRVCCTIRQSI